MPDAAIVTISEAVVSLLNAQELSQTFTASRVYIPNYNIELNPGLQVFVLSLAQVIDIAGGDRASSADTYSVTIAIYKQLTRTVGQIVPADVDGMLYFVEQVSDVLKSNDIEGGGTLVAIRSEPLWDAAQLDTNGTFVSVLKADYLLYR